MRVDTAEFRANDTANSRRERELRRGKDPGLPHSFGQALLDAEWLPEELRQAQKDQRRLEGRIARFRETVRGLKRAKRGTALERAFSKTQQA